VLSVLRAAKANGVREWAMIVLAYKHGLRASEVCNLRIDDLDLKNGSIVVARLKGSLRTTQAVTEHRGEPLLNERMRPTKYTVDQHLWGCVGYFALLAA
jgi:integrase